MESEPAVWTCWASGADVAPLVAAVTVLVHMHMQRDIAAYWDRVMRLRVRGAQGTKVLFVILVLFIMSELITEFLVSLQVVLKGHRHFSQVAYANVKGGVRDMFCEGLMYFGICDVGGGHEVLKEVCGNVMLVGEYVP